MTTFAQRCGIHDEQREHALRRTARLIDATGLELVRFAWCDLHGMTRGKTLVASAAARAMQEGVGMVSTLMLKDSSDRTAFKVFEPGGAAGLPGFEFASNLLLLADPATLQAAALDDRHRMGLRAAVVPGRPAGGAGHAARAAARAGPPRRRGALHEVRAGDRVPHLPHRRHESATRSGSRPSWPGTPPAVSMIHPGYSLLMEACYDMAEEPLRIVQHTAQALGLPLLSLEVELGPSQVEAVFEATDALAAADNMVLFRNAVKQALRRAGYHASFMCRPPFPNIMSSGWHLHQSLLDCEARAATCSAARRRRTARRLPMRATRCRPPASTTWPACWNTHAPWRCSARRP